MARRPSRNRSRGRRGRVSRKLGEVILSVRTAAWIGRKLARVVRSDLRRQMALLQRRMR